MALLTREEFSKRLGQVLRMEREKRGLSRSELVAKLSDSHIDPERYMRKLAALSVTARQIRRKKGLTRKQVAERGSLPVEFVRDIEACKVFNPELYLVYCLSYGLGISFSQFVMRVGHLSLRRAR